MGNAQMTSGDAQATVGNLGNAASLAIKSVTGVVVVVGSLNPVILPATAAVLFTVAVFFTLKGMHLRFITYLTTTVEQLKDMFFFIMWMQDIVGLMIANADETTARQIKGFNLHTKKFQDAIQLLNEVLKKFAPPSIQGGLQQDASPAEPAKTSFTSRIKSSTRNVFGVTYRFLNSSVLLKKVERLFQNVIVAFQIMQARFFLLLNLHSETFDKIKGKFMDSQAFKKDQTTDSDGTLSQSFLDIASPFKDLNPPPPPEVTQAANATADDVKDEAGPAAAPAAATAAGGGRSRRLKKTLKRRVLPNWRRKLLKLLRRA